MSAGEETRHTSSRGSQALRLEDYEILRTAGKGRFSEVFQARHGSSYCALKKFSKECMETAGLRRRVEEEIQLLQSLDHPNIVKHFGMLRGDHGEIYIVLEWADGGDLKQLLKRHRQARACFSESRIWNLFVQIVRGVHYMHEHRVMHRDLKPANILVMRDLTVKVGDLGLSKKLSELVQELHSRVGTPLYMAPEVLTNLGYSFSSDVWSMGCILYELITLNSPFRNNEEGRDADENEGDIIRLVHRVSTASYPAIPEKLFYSQSLRDLVKTMLVPEPAKRIDCATVLAQAEAANKMNAGSLSPATAYVKSTGGSVTANAAAAAAQQSTSSSLSFGIPIMVSNSPPAQRLPSPRSASLNPRLSSLSDQPVGAISSILPGASDSARRPPKLSIPGEAPISVISPHSARVITGPGSSPEGFRLRRRNVSAEIRPGSGGSDTPPPASGTPTHSHAQGSGRPKMYMPQALTTASSTPTVGLVASVAGTPTGRSNLPQSPRSSRLVSSGTFQAAAPSSPRSAAAVEILHSPKSARLPPRFATMSPRELISRKGHHRRTISAAPDFSPGSSSSKSPTPARESTGSEGPSSPIPGRPPSSTSDEEDRRSRNEGARSRAALHRLSVATDRESLLKASPEMASLRKMPATASVLPSTTTPVSDFRRARRVVASISASELSTMSPLAGAGGQRPLSLRRPLTPSASSQGLSPNEASSNPFSTRRTGAAASPRSGGDPSLMRRFSGGFISRPSLQFASSPLAAPASTFSTTSNVIAATPTPSLIEGSGSLNPFASSNVHVSTPKSGRPASFFGIDPLPSISETATSPVSATPSTSEIATVGANGFIVGGGARSSGSAAAAPALPSLTVGVASPQSARSTAASGYKFAIWANASNNNKRGQSELVNEEPTASSFSPAQPLIHPLSESNDAVQFAPSLTTTGLDLVGNQHSTFALQKKPNWDDGTEGGEQIEYLLGEIIGEGSFARVYRAVDPRTGQSVAVKQMHIEDYDSEAAVQMEQEISFLSTLSHPNLVKYLGTSRFNNRLNVILEYCTEGSISSMLRVYKRFPEQLIRLYTRQMVDALMYLHAKKIVHRDIKGGNVLVHGDGTRGVIKLSDFGCSKTLLQSTKDLERSTKMKGTVLWMAPEAANQSPETGTPSDIWSLGATIIEMATGRPPWSEEQFQSEITALLRIAITKTPPRFPSEVLSPSGIAFLRCCMQVEANKRYSAKQLAIHEFLVVEQQAQVSTAEVGKRPQTVGAAYAHLAAAKGRDMQQAKEQVIQRNIEGAIEQVMVKFTAFPDHPDVSWSDVFTRDVEVTMPTIPVRLRGLPSFFAPGLSGNIKIDGLKAFQVRMDQESPKGSEGPTYRFKALQSSKSPFIQVPSRTAMWKWEITGTVLSVDQGANLTARASGSAMAALDTFGNKFKTIEFVWNPVSLIEHLRLVRSPASSIQSDVMSPRASDDPDEKIALNPAMEPEIESETISPRTADVPSSDATRIVVVDSPAVTVPPVSEIATGHVSVVSNGEDAKTAPFLTA